MKKDDVIKSLSIQIVHLENSFGKTVAILKDGTIIDIPTPKRANEFI